MNLTLEPHSFSELIQLEFNDGPPSAVEIQLRTSDDCDLTNNTVYTFAEAPPTDCPP